MKSDQNSKPILTSSPISSASGCANVAYHDQKLRNHMPKTRASINAYHKENSHVPSPMPTLLLLQLCHHIPCKTKKGTNRTFYSPLK
jgi:hypothetical protein